MGSAPTPVITAAHSILDINFFLNNRQSSFRHVLGSLSHRQSQLASLLGISSTTVNLGGATQCYSSAFHSSLDAMDCPRFGRYWIDCNRNFFTRSRPLASFRLAQ